MHPTNFIKVLWNIFKPLTRSVAFLVMISLGWEALSLGTGDGFPLQAPLQELVPGVPCPPCAYGVAELTVVNRNTAHKSGEVCTWYFKSRRDLSTSFSYLCRGP